MCSYFVSPSEKQATLRGAEHRRALHFLPFAVAAILGAAGSKWNHSVLTWAMCELAALLRDIFGPACLGGGVKVKRARELTARLATWVHRDFQGLFGPLHTPKLHRLLAHVLDELRMRGSLLLGDTGIYESKHKGVKKAYTRTNRGRTEHALQMLMAEQVADALSWEAADKDEDDDVDVANNDDLAAGDGANVPPPPPAASVDAGAQTHPAGSATPRGARVGAIPVVAAAVADHAAAPGPCAAPAVDAPSMSSPPRQRRHGVPMRVGVIAAERSIEGLAECLELTNNDVLTVPVGTYLAHGTALRRGGQRRQIVRASMDYLGGPWLDWVEYTSADGGYRVGRARVVITGIGKRPVRLLVVERARRVPADNGCPFAAYKCTRLQFDMKASGVTPAIECVPVNRVKRVLCVEDDWVNWVSFYGLEVMPEAVATTRHETARARFFVNAFSYL